MNHFILQTNIDTSFSLDIVYKAIEASSFAFLVGLLVGIFLIIRWLDIPDKLLAVEAKLDKMASRQRKILAILSKTYNFFDDDEKTESR